MSGATERRLRICIVGNSVGLRMRPRRRHAGEHTYAELLMRRHEVFNACRAGALITEQFRYLDDDVVARAPDVTILNFGIVEVFERRTLRRLNNLPIRNYYNNLVMGRDFSPRPGLRHTLARVANGLLRRLAERLGLSWPWLPLPTYLAALKAICDLVLSETGSRVIVVEVTPIPPGTPKFDARTDEAIRRVNETVRQWAAASGGRLLTLALPSEWPQAHFDRLVPDAIHFSALGHRLLHAGLQRLIDVPR